MKKIINANSVLIIFFALYIIDFEVRALDATNDLNIITYSIKEYFILIISIYIFMRMLDGEKIKNRFIALVLLIPISSITFLISRNFGTFYCFLFQLISLVLLNKLNMKNKIRYTIINTIISLGISYLLFFLTIIIVAIPTNILNIKNDYIILIIIIVLYVFLVWRVFKIKKIRNGLIYLKDKTNNENMDILLLNISMMILFVAMILPGRMLAVYPTLNAFLFSIIIIITIKKSLDAYYKQTLLIQDLKDTKKKLEEKEKEVEELERENLEYGKRSHTLAHKQKIIESKLDEIMNSEISTEIDLKDEVKKLSKEVYGEKKQAELVKTGISMIDDVLKCMQNECICKNIDFELQVNGNIHYMINHFVEEEELQILIADHVKDAIIAIESSDNINRSILVKIGEIDGIFGLYIYDSGIEFEKEVLDNLGKKPITTHKNDGGTGMGFMNTFDTLKKHNASLIIKEIGSVSEIEYTKVIMIKFDNNGEFNIDSYR